MRIAGQVSIDDIPNICPLLSRAANPQFGEKGTRVVDVSGVRFGGERPIVIGGPCAVESHAQTVGLAHAVKRAGADMLRGGAYKPRTSPHDFQGSGLEGLCILSVARQETDLPIVTEVMDPRMVGEVAQVADMLQIGSRNMHNYSLLAEVGRARKPILLKRGMSASLCEWLGAAEYIAKQGNLDIVLCERGIRGFPSGEYSRYVLDLNVIPAAKMLTFLPVVVDPSHATGVAAMVEPASRAALEMGSHGLLIEVADFSFGEPKCDGLQAIDAATLTRIVEFAHHHDSPIRSRAGVAGAAPRQSQELPLQTP